MTPLELITKIAALVPSPRAHRHRTYGVLAPNASPRPVVTALAPAAVPPAPASAATREESRHRAVARNLWARPLARIHEALPMSCPICHSQVRIIDCINDAGAVKKILDQIGESTPESPLDFLSFDGSMLLLYEGAILAVNVVWLFLHDFRATFVSAVALPLSVIPAFIGMQYLAFSLNVVTLLALSLVVGILVDDAVVEVENIVRHLRMGKTPFQAAMEAADEIGLAVIATTFTLIAVFLPTAFMSGIAGKFFKQFGWTGSLAVFASLVVARMLTPMMAAYILKPSAPAAHAVGAAMRAYMRMAAWCLKHRWATLFMSAAFFAGSVALIPLLPTGFIPPDDLSQSQVHVELPPGATLAQTRAAAEKARAGGRRAAREEHLHHHHRRRRRRLRPIRAARRGRGAQGNPDGAARRARRAAGAKAGHQAADPRGALQPARGAHQGGPGRLRGEVCPGIDRRRSAGARRGGAGCRARPAHHCVHRQLRLDGGADPPRALGQARLRARRGGMSRLEALLDACHKRARPIVMTTIAMGADMLPVAFGSGAADPSLRSPMAIAVIGGLITSTFLSLLVIPVVFTFIDDLALFVGRAVTRLRGGTPPRIAS